MALRIPEQRQDAMASLMGMNQAQWRILLDALYGCDATVEPDALIKKASSEVEEQIPFVRDALHFLLTLCSVRLSDRSALSAFLEDLKDAAARTGRDELNPENIDWEAFASNLHGVLDEPSPLYASAKLRALGWDRPNVVSESRITSDLRPAFKNDISEAPDAFVILHSLRITHFDSEDRRELFFSLDAGQLRELRDEVDRALNKEAILSETIASTGWKVKSGKEKD